MELGLKGRKAIVSAAGKGLGKACARSLAAEGVALTINARSADTLQATAREIRDEFGVDVTAVAADYNSKEGREAILAACPQPDILVSNPGVRQVPDPFDKIDADGWRYWLEVHFLSSVEMVQAVAPGMRDRGFGRIVNISSINGQKGQMGQVNYSAAKAGVIGFTKALAQENARKGITVNCVAPGYIDTDMVAAVPEKVLEGIVGAIPVGRLGQADEIGQLVAYLASDHAGFITGATLDINGGQYMA